MNSSTIIAALALTGVLGTLGATGAVADRALPILKPIHGVSFDVGDKHAMSYFVADSGKCKLTMVMGDKMKEDVVPTTAGTRFNVAIDAGKSARIDTAEGKSVEFSCAPGATMVSVRVLEGIAYVAPAAKK